MNPKNPKTRLQYTIKNIVYSFVGYAVITVLSFISRKLFLLEIGLVYQGVNSAFSDVLVLLSLAEMGFTSAIIASLYKPIAQNDVEKIRSLLALCKKIYHALAVVMALGGLAITPFIYQLVNDTTLPYLQFYFLLFVGNSVVSYLFSYKQCLFFVNQKNYISTVVKSFSQSVQMLLQIAVILFTHNFTLYIIVQGLCTLLNNFIISYMANKEHPYLRSKAAIQPLQAEEKQFLFRNVKAFGLTKIGSTIVQGTDNIIITAFLGFVTTGLYSNYYMITNTIKMFVTMVFNAANGSIGNINHTETEETRYNVFWNVFLFNGWLSMFCSVSLLVLLNPFISLMFGQQYLLSLPVVAIVVANFYLVCIANTASTYIGTFGLYWHQRYRALFEVPINLVVSLLLVKPLGVFGVFLGTFVSFVCTVFWWEPHILFKHGFARPAAPYFKKLGLYTLATVGLYLVTEFYAGLVPGAGYANFVGQVLVCLVVPNLLFVALFWRTQQMRNLWGIVKGVARKVLRRK
ncbi:hypothetical protein LJC61_07275 [Ruminococcaceae bacterium OttesenSCG-928-A16]|nr:hypothetical protein [Ruminococcaceae bacterium OttesenSCG-928-A16]